MLFFTKNRLCIGELIGGTAFDGRRLAKAMNLSEVQLYRKIKGLTGKSSAIYSRCEKRCHLRVEELQYLGVRGTKNNLNSRYSFQTQSFPNPLRHPIPVHHFRGGRQGRRQFFEFILFKGR